ncbi:membrane cofactor protein-like [Poeciliopsis prolifica]|uniref:membrane cofactor protein-like n=1 Tax=Poeciliopsis prolifica TaxID=188132 RepID=UPI0024131F36|nr:membrane cofactor protein-like [Poeciliopsis prolifica]
MEVFLDTHRQRKLLILSLLIGNVALTEIDCGLPKADEHMYIVTSGSTEFYSMAKVGCEEGYQISGSSFKICVKRGWFGQSFCVIVTCSKPTEVKNGEHSWDSDEEPEYQQMIHYTCNTGYTMVGNENIRCTKAGEYDSEPPPCITVTCSKPTKVENGKHSWNSDCEPEYQQKIYFSCNTGYTMFGSESIQCTKLANMTLSHHNVSVSSCVLFLATQKICYSQDNIQFANT